MPHVESNLAPGRGSRSRRDAARGAGRHSHHNPQDVPGTQNSPNKTNSRAASEWPTGMPNEAQVKLHLKADGYTDIHDVKRSAGGWSAKAMYQGKPVTVAIGPDGSIARR